MANLKISFKRYLCFLLCIIMVLSNSMFSFANNGITDNAGGQGNTSSAATGSGNGTFKVPANIGLRFTITDNSGNIVGTVNGSKGSLDVLNDGAYNIVEQNKGNMIYGFGCATDDSVSNNYSYIRTSDFLKLIGQGAVDNPVPNWMQSDESLHGEDIRKWIMNNAQYVYNPSFSQTSGGGSSSSSSGTSSSGSSNSSSSSGSSSTYVDTTDYYALLYSYVGKVPDPNLYQNYTQYTIRMNSWYSGCANVLKAHLETGRITSSQYATLLKRLNDFNDASLMEARMILASNFIDDLFSINAYASSNTGTTSTTVDQDSKEDGWAWEIINLYDGSGNYYFQLPGASKTKAEFEAGGKRPGDIFLENDYRLVVENIIVGKPQNYVNGAPGASYPKYVLGTAHDWALFGASAWKSWGGNDSFGNHQRYLTRALPRALVTVSDWYAPDGSLVLSAPVEDDQWKISEMVIKERYESGFGTQVYSPGDIGGSSPNVPNESIPNMIDTYDITTNPRIDAPSEPSTGKQDPTDYGSKALTFSIDKHYRYKDENGVYIEKSYYTTVNAPHTIAITDEVNQTGYKLKDWFTSTDGWLPTSGNPRDYTWETVVKGQHKNGTYEGTDETLLIVQPSDPDNVLHLLYEYEGIPSSSVIDTYDITTNPTTPAPSEPSTGKPTESSYGTNSLTFSIDKHYRYKDAATGKVTEESYFTTINAPHTVVISEEVDKTGYKLKDWFTSTDGWLPQTGKSPSIYNWETVVKGQHKNGQYEGSSPTTLVVKPTDSDNVLHLLYEYEGLSDLNVVKIYQLEDEYVSVVRDPYVVDKTTEFSIPQEASYEYIETLQSDKDPYTRPSGIDGWEYMEALENYDSMSSSDDDPVSILDDTKTIYIVYRSVGAQIKLYSNELSYTYDLKDLVSSRKLFSIYDKAESGSSGLTKPSCPGHRRHPGCDHSEGEYNCYTKYHDDGSKSWVDQRFSLSVINDYDYDEDTSYIKDWEFTSSTSKAWYAQMDSAYNPGESNGLKVNGSYLLYRDKSCDVVTLYPDKNPDNSLLSELQDIGITKTSYSPSGTRLASDMKDDKFFTRHFQTYFEYGSHDIDLKSKWTRSASYGEVSYNDYIATTVTSPYMANEYYSGPYEDDGSISDKQNVVEYYYVGETNNGLSENNVKNASFGSKYKYSQGFASTSSLLKFYPYIRMRYYSKGESGNGSSSNAAGSFVYVTSENLSTMKVFNAIQAGVYKKNEINVNLTSTQWSTHARSLSFLENKGVSDKQSVLPGGAIQDLDMGNKGDTQVGVIVYQSCLPDENVKMVQSGFDVSVSDALSSAESLKSEIEKVLEGYGLVQWGIEGFESDHKEIMSSGEELHESTNIDFILGNSGLSSSDSKYYLRHDGSGSSRANFDVLETNIASQYEVL